MKYLFISTSRADFGILSNLVAKFKNEKFKILFTGTQYNIFDDKSVEYKYDKINIGSENNNLFNEVSELFIKISNYFIKNKPDIIIILGDRYELFYIASIAHILRIKIVHLHGGEITNGAIDDAFRHSISKFAHLHFVTHDKYKNRLQNMGESPNSIFNFGSLSVQNIIENYYVHYTYKEYMKKDTCLVIYHPQTILSDYQIDIKDIIQLLIKSGFKLYIFTPNNDPGSNLIKNSINDLKYNKHCTIINNLNQNDYLLLLRSCKFIIGNSSSGIIEAPNLKIPTINLGYRQKNRLPEKVLSIINCYNLNDVRNALNLIKTEQFYNDIMDSDFLFYKKNTSENIYKKIIEFEYGEKIYYEK